LSEQMDTSTPTGKMLFTVLGCRRGKGAQPHPVARGGPARRAAKSAAGGSPRTVGLALRCALNAPLFGLRRAALRSKPTDYKKPGGRRSSPARIVAPRASGREII
jgi:hypothetical protein